MKKISLTSSQFDIWIDQNIRSDSPLYNIGGYINIEGIMDYDAFNKTINLLVQRNDALRLQFSTDENDDPYQVIQSYEEFDLLFMDFSNEGNPLQSALAWMESDFRIPFDLRRDSLYKCCLIKIEDNHYFSYNKYHHLIIDGWGVSLTGDQIIDTYNSLIENGEAPPLEKEYSFTSFIEDNNDYLKSERYRDAERYWKHKFSKRTDSILTSPVFSSPDSSGNKSDRRAYIIKNDDFSKLTDLGKSVNATTFNVLLTILYIYLFKITGLKSLVVGIPLLNRSTKSFKKTVGLFVDTSPLLVHIDSAMSFNELVTLVGLNLKECYRYQRYPAGSIEKLAGANSQNRLYDIILSYEKHSYEKKIQEFNTQVASLSGCHQNNALTMHVEEHQQGADVVVNFDFRPDVFQNFTIDNFINHFDLLYKNIILNPALKISEINIVPEKEKNLLLNIFNNTKVEFPSNQTVIELFEEQVKKTPDTIGIIFDDIQLTYRELDKKASLVAGYLIQNKGVTPGDFVGLMLDRSDELVIGLLGILKAGGAYIPIDPEYPENRIDYILKDSKVETVLSSEDNGIFVDIKKILSADISFVPPRSRADSMSPVYIIYTSGTTGTPKGAIVSNANYINYISWAKEYYFDNEDCGSFPLFTSISFDLTTTSVFLSLLRGKTLKVFSRKEEISNILTDIFNSEIVDSVKLTPSHISILSSLQIRNSNISLAIVGGEELQNDQVRILKEINRDMKIVNEYGPTETTVGCIVKQIETKDEKILIGKPIHNTQVYILDKNLKILPIGVPGEISIGGAGVGIGYLNKPDLTAEKFIENPFSEKERIYRTGDLARWLPDGNIEFLGRIDDQVKIRGFRIELGEIENTILSHPEVKNVVVTVNKRQNGEKTLIAYYVSENELNISSLRSYIGKTLPDYMIPFRYLHLESLPLTVNGKVDKRALPEPDMDTLDTCVAFAKAEKVNEKILVDIWQEVLACKKEIGIDDNFFMLGGDSIKAIQIMSRLNRKGLKGEIVVLFDNPTIREFASTLTDNVEISDQSQISGMIPLTPVQNWFFKDLNCAKHHYNQSVMLRLKEKMDETGVRALERSVRELLHHHDALRMSFKEANGEYIQDNRRDAELNFRQYDLTLETKPELKIEEIANEIQNSFNLENDTLIIFTLFQLKDECRLLIVSHHLIIDGVSWRILLEDFESGYRQVLDNKDINLPLKTTSFKDWSEKLVSYSKSNELKKRVRFWKKAGLYKGVLPENNSCEKKEKTSSTIHFRREETDILLTKTNQAFHAGVSDILLTALIRALSRWCGETTISIDLESHGRPDSFKGMDLSRSIGWFTSLYPVVLDISDCDDVEEEVISVKENLEEIRDKGIGYGVLRYLSGELAHDKDSEILFNYLGQFDNEVNTNLFELASESTGENMSPEAVSLYKLEINGLVSDGKISMKLDSQYYDQEIVNKISAIYKEELLGMINYSDDKLALIGNIRTKSESNTIKKPQRIRI